MVGGPERDQSAQTRPSDLARVARGRWGEDQAARWYRAHGYQLLDRNWRCDVGELDLVVAAGRTVVFVEVKARSTDYFGAASSAVDHRKQRRLRILAARWFAAHPDRHGPTRFDVVAITGTRVEVLIAAF
jgi:putative endonuclease